jgi:short-subunit dehydrogenase
VRPQDVLVNAAGFVIVGAVEELSDAELFEQVDVNVFGCVNSMATRRRSRRRRRRD